MPDLKKPWVRERTCCDCGKVQSVRKDNRSERCVSCSGRRNASTPAAQTVSARQRTSISCTCIHCASVFSRTPSQIARRGGKYCSIKCANENRQVERVCKCCGVNFKIGRARVHGTSNSSGNYCSRKCYDKWLCRTERTTGRGSQWRAIRLAQIKKSPYCGWCGSVKKRLQVHHIVPFRLTHDNSDANLIPLCGSCHKHVELLTVEIEATGISPDEMATVLGFFLGQRQAATAAILKRLTNESRA